MTTNATINLGPPNQRSFRKSGGNNQQKQSGAFGQGLSRSARRRRARALRRQAQAGILRIGQTNVQRALQERLGGQSYKKSNPGYHIKGGVNNSSNNGNSQEGGSISDHVHFALRQNTPEDRAKYVAGVMDPFSAPEGIKYVGGTFAQPTDAYRYIESYTGTVNANGDALVVFRPQNGSGNSLVRLYNNAAFDSSTGSNGPNNATEVFQVNTRFADDGIASHRTVAASIQVRSLSAPDKKAGMMRVAFLPLEATVIQQGPAMKVIQDAFFRGTLNGDQVAEVIWIPRDDIDFDFTAPGTAVLHSNCVVLCTGFEANSKINIDVCVHREFIPSATNYFSKPQPASLDSSATRIINEVVNSQPKYITSPGSDFDLYGSIFGDIKDKAWDYAGKNVIPAVIANVLNYGSKFVPNLLTMV